MRTPRADDISKRERVPVLFTRFNFTRSGSTHFPSFPSDLLDSGASHNHTRHNPDTMEGVQLRDEAAQDRVRAAIEFLDPSKYHRKMGLVWTFQLTTGFFDQAMHGRAG